MRLGAQFLIQNSKLLIRTADTVRSLLAALMRHDVQHHFVGAVHCFSTDAGEIADGTVYVVIDDAFHGRHALAFH